MKVWLRTFGCRANQYDTEQVRAMVEAAGGTIVASPDEADAAVFNSCAVTGEAEAELRRAVRSAARRRPALRSVIMGCASALPRAGARALDVLPTVEALVPGADLPAVARALGLPDAPPGAARGQTGARALLRIQDGCDEHCTFCATTLARGANRSRPADALVEEARALAERHPEVVVTGIHVGSWGADVGSSLGALVERLVREVPQVRFRLSSVEATEVDDRLRELFAEPAHLCPHLHAPLQSGSDRLLRRMGRHWYSAERYAEAVERLLARRGTFGLGADIITGFPGETEADHSATLALVERLPFTYLHVFPWSPRPGTAAERLPDPVPPPVAASRAAELRALGERKAAAYRLARAGGEADVVTVGGAGRREALTGDYLACVPDDPAVPRGIRYRATLEITNGVLRALPSM